MESCSECFLYHLCPPTFLGEELLPLNVIRERYPELYEQQQKKYQHRPTLPKRPIPPLNCEWADLLMFSFVPPQVIVSEYLRAGKTITRHRPWLRISLNKLDTAKLAVYLFDTEITPDEPIPEGELVPYTHSLLPKITSFTNGAREHYRLAENPLLFWRIAHGLYKGTVPRAHFDIIETS